MQTSGKLSSRPYAKCESSILHVWYSIMHTYVRMYSKTSLIRHSILAEAIMLNCLPNMLFHCAQDFILRIVMSITPIIP